jgi:uncharacterized OB-fold protein
MSNPTSISAASPAKPARIPIREGLLSTPLTDLSAVRLMGSRCTSCGETSLGTSEVCANCGRDTVTSLPLSRRGHVWTYTIVRHKPPGDYKGPDPFVPFALGLVELPEGLRVLTPIECALKQVRIGMPVEFRAFVREPDGGPEVVTFAFAPSAAGEARV